MFSVLFCLSCFTVPLALAKQERRVRMARSKKASKQASKQAQDTR